MSAHTVYKCLHDMDKEDVTFLSICYKRKRNIPNIRIENIVWKLYKGFHFHLKMPFSRLRWRQTVESLRITNWEECGRKPLWLNLKNHFRICLEGLRNTPRHVVSTAEVKTDYRLNKSQKLHSAIHCARLLFVRESVPLPF